MQNKKTLIFLFVGKAYEVAEEKKIYAQPKRTIHNSVQKVSDHHPAFGLPRTSHQSLDS